MSLRAATLALAASTAQAANWAVLIAGSKGYDNYRHQADLYHAYGILIKKGLSPDRIITLAFNDIATDSSNPFQGKVFNSPDATGPGVDVYAGVKDHLDYTGDAVTPANFAAVLLGKETTGGTGRTLKDTAPGDDVFLYYTDHGAPGVLEFPDGSVMHTAEFQSVVKQMHDEKRFGRFLVYIEACNSGSMLEGIPTDINVYGVTAVGADRPSLGTYCGNEATINNQKMNTCLGDLFSVHFMNYIVEGDGSRTLGSFFTKVMEDVASYASLHYSNQVGEQFGAVDEFSKLTLKEFFYPDGDVVESAIQVQLPPWKKPEIVYSQPRIEQQRLYDIYTEASAVPLERGEKHWEHMKDATDALQLQIHKQDLIQDVYWELVRIAFNDQERQTQAWRDRRKPVNPDCEIRGHMSLKNNCGSQADMTTAYALQFHQVMVNLCGSPDLSWGQDAGQAEGAASEACRRVIQGQQTAVIV